VRYVPRNTLHDHEISEHDVKRGEAALQAALEPAAEFHEQLQMEKAMEDGVRGLRLERLGIGDETQYELGI
jgi:hypothetical protein